MNFYWGKIIEKVETFYLAAVFTSHVGELKICSFIGKSKKNPDSSFYDQQQIVEICQNNV